MDDLIRIQKEEIDKLREQVRQLQDLLCGTDVIIRQEWGLVRAEQRVFGALCRRDVVTKEMLYSALYSDRMDLDSDPATSVVESHVSKMRRKLMPFGIVVRSQRFVGYSLVDREKSLNTPPRAEKFDERGRPCLTSSTRNEQEFQCLKSGSVSLRMR